MIMTQCGKWRDGDVHKLFWDHRGESPHSTQGFGKVSRGRVYLSCDLICKWTWASKEKREWKLVSKSMKVRENVMCGRKSSSLIVLEPEVKATVLRDEEKQADNLMVKFMPPFCSDGKELTDFKKGNDIVKFGKGCEFEKDKTRNSKIN